MVNNTNIKVDIINYKNNNCTEYEITQFFNIFKEKVVNMVLSSSARHIYVLDRVALDLGLPRVAILIERIRVNETNRICNNTEISDHYTATFVNEEENIHLIAKAIVFDKTIDQVTCYETKEGLECYSIDI